MFVRDSQLAEARLCVKRYAKFKELSEELLKLYIDWARKGGLESEDG